jgi:diguanylate cyclase (GGDEF)-like protein
LRLRDSLRSQAIRDPLTGLFNRRYLDERLERELRRAAHDKRPVGLIMLDLDCLKACNDSFGHEAGDTLLRAVGSLLQEHTRSEDLACRYGGDEFALVLPKAPLSITRQRAEELRNEFKHLNVRYGNHVLGTFSLSLGISTFPDHGTSPKALLQEADKALYQAKAGGGNRVVVGQTPRLKS